jgi:hypothetical protein
MFSRPIIPSSGPIWPPQPKPTKKKTSTGKSGKAGKKKGRPAK